MERLEIGSAQRYSGYFYKKMDEVAARQIATWHYEPPYDIYNPDSNNIDGFVKFLLNPDFRYFSIWDGDADELIAFRCFGLDAQVPGGDYSADALDMGGGLRPDLTGRGLGATIMESAFEFARKNCTPKAFRATVAAFNQRALNVCQKVGYKPVQRFIGTHSGREFVVLMREV